MTMKASGLCRTPYWYSRLSPPTAVMLQDTDMGTFRTGRFANRVLENGATPKHYTAGVQVATT